MRLSKLLMKTDSFHIQASFKLWEGWKKFIKPFAAKAITRNKLWASHQSWCLITTMGHSERRKLFQVLVGFTSSEWLPDGALSCLEIPPGGWELSTHSAAGWMGSLCHPCPACETQLTTSGENLEVGHWNRHQQGTHGQRERPTALPKMSRSSLTVWFMWFINSLGLCSKLLQLERGGHFQ